MAGLAGVPGTHLRGTGQEATLHFTAQAGAAQSHQEKGWGLLDKADPSPLPHCFSGAGLWEEYRGPPGPVGCTEVW